jgi:hypothetical protein
MNQHQMAETKKKGELHYDTKILHYRVSHLIESEAISCKIQRTAQSLHLLEYVATFPEHFSDITHHIEIKKQNFLTILFIASD